MSGDMVSSIRVCCGAEGAAPCHGCRYSGAQSAPCAAPLAMPAAPHDAAAPAPTLVRALSLEMPSVDGDEEPEDKALTALLQYKLAHQRA